MGPVLISLLFLKDLWPYIIFAHCLNSNLLTILNDLNVTFSDKDSRLNCVLIL